MPFLYLTFAGAVGNFLFCNSKANEICDRQAQCIDKCTGCTDRPSQSKKLGGRGGGQMPPAFPLAMLMPVALLSAVL